MNFLDQISDFSYLVFQKKTGKVRLLLENRTCTWRQARLKHTKWKWNYVIFIKLIIGLTLSSNVGFAYWLLQKCQSPEPVKLSTNKKNHNSVSTAVYLFIYFFLEKKLEEDASVRESARGDRTTCTLSRSIPRGYYFVRAPAAWR